MALPLGSMTSENVDAAVAHLNETYDEYRIARAMHECNRLCVHQTVLDENAVLCPNVDLVRSERLIVLNVSAA